LEDLREMTNITRRHVLAGAAAPLFAQKKDKKKEEKKAAPPKGAARAERDLVLADDWQPGCSVLWQSGDQDPEYRLAGESG